MSRPLAGRQPLAAPRRAGEPPQRRQLLAVALAAATGWLTACAPLPRQRATAADGWAGRLALTVRDEPVQTFAAGFELRGNPDQGTLQLVSPLGTTLAHARWSNGLAQLQSGGQTQAFDSLPALLQAVTGARLPVNALFDWLSGADTPADGWQADLSRRADGRILARRLAPLPAVELRIVLDP